MKKPRNVRNFWIDLDVDGRSNSVGTGPIAKDGGFSMTISIRENGKISDNKIRIVGTAHESGNINIVVANFNENNKRNTK